MSEDEFAGYDEWEVAEFRGMSDVERIRYALSADYSDESPANHPALPLAALDRLEAQVAQLTQERDDWKAEVERLRTIVRSLDEAAVAIENDRLHTKVERYEAALREIATFEKGKPGAEESWQPTPEARIARAALTQPQEASEPVIMEDYRACACGPMCKRPEVHYR